MGLIERLKKVRDFLRTRFRRRVPISGPLASTESSLAAPPAATIPPQTIVGPPTGSDAIEGASTISTVVDVSAPLAKISTQTLSPVQVLVPSASEESRMPSPAPDSEALALRLFVQTARGGMALEKDAREGSQLESYPEDSSVGLGNRSFVSAGTETLSVTAYTVHCYIPQKITDEIILSLDSPSTLCRCALVCKNWLPASRRRLFLHVELDKSPARYDLLVSRVLRCENMRPWLAHVRELSFNDEAPRVRNSKEPVMERGHRLVHDFSGRFPNLLYLRFSSVDCGGCPGHPSAYLTFFTRLRSLQRLDLNRCHFPSFFSFWRTVAALSSLRILTLTHVDWPSARTGSPIVSRALARWPKLHTFNFTFDRRAETRVHTLLGLLSQTSTPSSIRTVQCLGPKLFSENLEFFEAVGSSVAELTVLHNACYDLRAGNALSSFSQLESLGFGDVEDGEGWKNLATTLQNLPSLLRQLTICAELKKTLVEGDHKIEDEGLELLDPVLDRDNFTNLKHVRFEIGACKARNLDEEVAKSTIIHAWEMKLPKLNARGIMKLDILF